MLLFNLIKKLNKICIGKRQCEDEDEKEVITKKQKIDEVVEMKEIKEETDSDYLKIGKFFICFPSFSCFILLIWV